MKCKLGSIVFLTSIFLTLIFLTGCNDSEERKGTDVAPQQSYYEYHIPEVTQDNWQTRSLTEVNINQEIIEQMMLDIDDGKYGPIDSSSSQ